MVLLSPARRHPLPPFRPRLDLPHGRRRVPGRAVRPSPLPRHAALDLQALVGKLVVVIGWRGCAAPRRDPGAHIAPEACASAPLLARCRLSWYSSSASSACACSSSQPAASGPDVVPAYDSCRPTQTDRSSSDAIRRLPPRLHRRPGRPVRSGRSEPRRALRSQARQPPLEAHPPGAALRPNRLRRRSAGVSCRVAWIGRVQPDDMTRRRRDLVRLCRLPGRSAVSCSSCPSGCPARRRDGSSRRREGHRRVYRSRPGRRHAPH